MRKTWVDIDEDRFKHARRLFGTTSIEQTIDTALREAVHDEARHQEVRALSKMDGLDLSKDGVTAKAWRSRRVRGGRIWARASRS